MTSSLHRIFAWRGACLPKVDTRFVCPHLVASLSSAASWPPVSGLTATFQGQLFHRRLASTGSYGPRTCRPPVRPAELRAFALSLIPSTRFVAHIAAMIRPNRALRLRRSAGSLVGGEVTAAGNGVA